MSTEGSKFAIYCAFDHDFWTPDISLPYSLIYHGYLLRSSKLKRDSNLGGGKKSLFLIGGLISQRILGIWTYFLVPRHAADCSRCLGTKNEVQISDIR